VESPRIRYANTPDGAYIAYQIIGDGPDDLVYVPGSSSSLSLSWENPLDARFLAHLASSTRLILVDRRGWGHSDAVFADKPPSLEQLVDDVTAVLDAAGSERAVIFGVFEGGPTCMLFAATHPARTRALVLYGTYARGAWAPDYPWAWTDEEFEADQADAERSVREGREEEYFDRWAITMVPSLADDPRFQSTLRKIYSFSGHGGSLSSQAALVRMEHEIDVRAVLPTIQVPTLVLNRTDDRIADFPEGRWLAEQIPGASFVELSGEDHPPWAGDQGSVIEAIRSFLGLQGPPAETNRVLATVLFTDIVDSTAKLAELGDAGWKDLLEAHDELAKRAISRFAGTFVDSSGDGVFATFDGPARAVRCAGEIASSIRERGVRIRAGCHTGEVEVMGEKVSGMAVHIGARIAALAGPDEVLVSSTVKDLVVGSGLRFEDLGEHQLKGVPAAWRLYRAVPT